MEAYVEGVNRDQVERTARLIRQAARRRRRREWLGRGVVIVWLVAAAIWAVGGDWIVVVFSVVAALMYVAGSSLEETAFRLGFLNAQSKMYRILVNTKIPLSDEQLAVFQGLTPPTYKEAKQELDTWAAVHNQPPQAPETDAETP